MEFTEKNTYRNPHNLKDIKDKYKKTICQHFKMRAPSSAEKYFQKVRGRLGSLEVGTSSLLYQIRHVELQGKLVYKLHAKEGFARSTPSINLKLTTTNSPMQLD